MSKLSDQMKTLILLAEGETVLSTEEYEAIHGLVDYINKIKTEVVTVISRDNVKQIAKMGGYELTDEEFKSVCDMTRKDFNARISLYDLIETNILYTCLKK